MVDASGTPERRADASDGPSVRNLPVGRGGRGFAPRLTTPDP